VGGLPPKRSNSAQQSNYLRAARRTEALLQEFQNPATAVLHWPVMCAIALIEIVKCPIEVLIVQLTWLGHFMAANCP
jgi:hypothetical protein